MAPLNAGSNTSRLALRHGDRFAQPILLGLVMFSVFINYIDRANLSIAAPLLKEELSLSGTQLGFLRSSLYWTYSLFLILSGWLVDRCRVGWVMARIPRVVGGHKFNRTGARVHKSFMITGTLGAGSSLVASALAGPVLCVAFLLLVGLGLGMSLSNMWPITQRLAGPRASGRWTGLQCAFGNLAGAVGSALTGLILDTTGHFFWAFVFAAGFCCIGAMSWFFVVGRIEPVQWRTQKAAPKLRDVAADPA